MTRRTPPGAGFRRRWGGAPWRRARTVRVRLAALYAGLFLGTAVVLLVVVNLLMASMLTVRVAGISANGLPDPAAMPGARPPGLAPTPIPGGGSEDVVRTATVLQYEVLRFQWLVTGVVIVLLTLVSVGVGWWLVGRVLHPIHLITATARRLSLESLHERIALKGPPDELKELADTFDAMIERLERAADSQRRFVANASHELRTPLAIQRATIEIGLTDPSPGRLPQVRRDLLNVNERSERLIDALLMLAQSERGLDDREPVPLDEVVARSVRELAHDGIEVGADLRPVTVWGDPVLLARLTDNLLHNAVRHNHPGGTVEVTLSGGALTVRNTGPEVPAERVGELFEPFRRLSPRTRSDGGAGLGLSIVAAIARAHDATVLARPNPGGGLEVTVRFAG
ncbi:sensor histidine kinase [Nonomuraea sp. CA-218870]|uniref:sensor histidine kinase n=1 Tax=Nonomuraea sp. CA-218870 TaxID=3239998 RepID=UPI003D91763B